MGEQWVEVGKWVVKSTGKSYSCRVSKEGEIFRSVALEELDPDRPWVKRHVLFNEKSKENLPIISLGGEGNTEGNALEDLLKKFREHKAEFGEGEYRKIKDLIY